MKLKYQNYLIDFFIMMCHKKSTTRFGINNDIEIRTREIGSQRLVEKLIHRLAEELVLDIPSIKILHSSYL
jgi:hypothetical protein